MTWVLVIGAGWLLLAVLTAVVIGRSVRLADARSDEDAAAGERNFIVDPATPPDGSAATILPFPAAGPEGGHSATPRPATHDTPTIPGIPAARPPAPGAGRSGSEVDPIRKTGLA